MGNDERRFMWNLAFCFTIAHREAAFKGYYAIRSLITFHGIFMASGYELGSDSAWNDSKWRKEVEESEEELSDANVLLLSVSHEWVEQESEVVSEE